MHPPISPARFLPVNLLFDGSLRESGDLENTPDSVLGLYREQIDHPDTDNHGLAELSVLKRRQLGEEVGTVRRLVWVGESYRDYAYPR